MAEPDYDMSIHTNPDATAWAKFYTETRDNYLRGRPTSQYDTEAMMVTWFANAMMAMHDHLTGQGMTVLPDGSAFFVANVPT